MKKIGAAHPQHPDNWQQHHPMTGSSTMYEPGTYGSEKGTTHPPVSSNMVPPVVVDADLADWLRKLTQQ